MIFATDHDLGTKIMTFIYNSARKRFPANRQKIKRAQRRLDEERQGIQNLFGAAIDDLGTESVEPGEDGYSYERPWPALWVPGPRDRSLGQPYGAAPRITVGGPSKC